MVLLQASFFGKMASGIYDTTFQRTPIPTTSSSSVLDYKDKLSPFALDYDTENKAATKGSDKEKSYELSDGNIITSGSERFPCPEVLFQSIGKEASGIPDTTFQSCLVDDVNIRKGLYENVVLSSGATILAGIGGGLTKELNALAATTLMLSEMD